MCPLPEDRRTTACKHKVARNEFVSWTFLGKPRFQFLLKLVVLARNPTPPQVRTHRKNKQLSPGCSFPHGLDFLMLSFQGMRNGVSGVNISATTMTLLVKFHSWSTLCSLNKLHHRALGLRLL